MIAHRGMLNERLTLLLALDRTDIGRLLCGTPVVWKRYVDADSTQYGPDVLITFVESPQEAARYAHELLTAGEKL